VAQGLGFIACKFLPWQTVLIFNEILLAFSLFSYYILYIKVIPPTRYEKLEVSNEIAMEEKG
jgi:hypothetical protein